MKIPGVALILLLAASCCAGTGHAASRQATAYCPSADRTWVGDLAVLEAHVQVGITYIQYGNYLTRAEVDYKLAAAARDSLQCLNQVTVPAERALNDYLKAYRSWSACLQKVASGLLADCNSGYGNSVRQGYWNNASSNLDGALSKLG